MTTTLLGAAEIGDGLARRLLLVEDDDDVRAQLAQALRDEGFEVTALTNAREAAEHLAAAAAPDAIVLDLLMPLMSGWEFLDWLAKRGVLSEVPVLVISGSPLAERARDLHPTVVASLTKPFSREDLVAVLDRILPRR